MDRYHKTEFVALAKTKFLLVASWLPLVSSPEFKIEQPGFPPKNKQIRQLQFFSTAMTYFSTSRKTGFTERARKGFTELEEATFQFGSHLFDVYGPITTFIAPEFPSDDSEAFVNSSLVLNPDNSSST